MNETLLVKIQADTSDLNSKMQAAAGTVRRTGQQINTSADDIKEALGNDLADAANKAGISMESLGGYVDRLRSAGISTESAMNSLKDTLEEMGVNSQKAGNALNNAAGSVGKSTTGLAAKIGLATQIAGMFINKAVDLAKEGLMNAYQASVQSNGMLAQTMDSLASSFQTMKNSLGGALGSILNAVAPVLNWIMAAVTKVGNAFSWLIALITGKSTYQRATNSMAKFADSTGAAASNLGSASESAKELKKTLLGFDEINALGDSELSNTGSLGGGGFGGGLNALDSGFEEASTMGTLEKVKQWFADAIEWIKTKWNTFWTGVKDKWNSIFEPNGSIGRFFGSNGVIANWWNGLFGAGGTIPTVWDQIFGKGGTIGQFFGEDGKIATWWSTLFGNNGKISKIWSSIFGNNGKISKIWDGLFGSDGSISSFFGSNGKIKKMWDDLFGSNGSIPTLWNSIFGSDGSIAKTWNTLFGASGTISKVWTSLFGNGGAISRIWNSLFGTGGTISSFFGDSGKIATWWNSAFGPSSKLSTMWTTFIDNLKNGWNGLFGSGGTVSTLWNNLFGSSGTITKLWNDLFGSSGTISSFFGANGKIATWWNDLFGVNGTIAKIWKNLFGSEGIIKSIWNSIWGKMPTDWEAQMKARETYNIMQVAFNAQGWTDLGWGVGLAIGGGIQDAIAYKVNDYLMKVTYTVNGVQKTETVYTTAWWQQHYKADGGMVTPGTMFIAGESGAEIVAHSSKGTGVSNVAQIEQAMFNALQRSGISGSDQPIEFTIKLDSDVLSRGMARGQRNRSRRFEVAMV